MPRKASRKIKVVLEVDELVYQRIAVAASKDLLTVTGYFNTLIQARFGEVLLPITSPLIPLESAPNEAVAHAPRSAIESNADSSTENEKRKRR